MVSVRCIIMTLAIASVIEIIIVFAIINGYLTEFESLLYLIMDEDQVEALKQIRSSFEDITDDDGGGLLGDIEPETRRALNQRFVQAVLENDLSTAQSLVKLGHHIDVNYGDNGQGHLLYRLCGVKKESPEMLKMVDFLLAQPNVDVNDDSSSWSPLKGAVHARNQQCVAKLLRHKDIVPMVHVLGLQCASVPHIVPEITLIIPADGKVEDCFLQHGKVILSNDKKVLAENARRHQRNAMQRAREKSWQQGSSSEGDTPQRSGGTQKNSKFAKYQQQQQQRRRQQHGDDQIEEYGGSVQLDGSKKPQHQQPQATASKIHKKRKVFQLVTDPSDFSSIYTATFFYLTGMEWEYCADNVKIALLVVGAHSLIAGWACVTYLSTMMEGGGHHHGHQHHHEEDAPAAAAAAAVAPENEQQQQQQQPENNAEQQNDRNDANAGAAADVAPPAAAE